jgi:TonB-linked SusC/RagA family outer membrane protein
MGYNYPIVKFIIFLFITSCFYSASAQVRNISGRVTNAMDGSPIPGASIVVKNTSIGSVTDIKGDYIVSIADENTILVVTSVGYIPQEIAVGANTVIDVLMQPSAETLSEVVVVGYGIQKHREVTGAVEQVNSAALKDIPVANLGQKFQGKFAGVQAYQINGEPGGGMAFRIRGQASINAGNSPIVVIDGFPVSSGLGMISPDEIESITVLKDASSASLYGSRGANGVILINTKNATEGQTNIEFSSYSGMSIVSDRGKPEVMDAREFAQFKKEYYEDKAMYEGYVDGVPVEYQNPDHYQEGTNWYNVLLQKAPTQNYNLALSTGAKDLKSSINFNYNKQDGVILNTFSERYSVRANTIYQASDRLVVGLNLAVSFRNSQITPWLGEGRNIIGSAFLMDPSLKYKNDDGTYPISFEAPGMFGNPNYYLVLTQRVNPAKETAILSNLFAEYELIKNLKYKIAANANVGNIINRSFEPSIARGEMFSPPPLSPIGSYATGNYQTWLLENSLAYEKTFFDKHYVNALAVYSVQKATDENASIFASQYPDDEVEWINAANAFTINATTSQWALLSYIGRLNYHYEGKYLLSLAFRRDGSSRFGSDAKWGNFPSIAAGWIASDETFLKSIEALNYLKIRMSYGKLGNNNIGNYSHLAEVVSSNYVFNDAIASGRALAGIGNETLTWETTLQYDAGVDIGVLNDRIFFTYDYYSKKTDGLLYGINIPQQSGFSQITSNIGKFKFWGHEFSVSSKNLIAKKLTWNTNVNIAFNRNRAITLGTNNTPIGGNANQGDYNRTQVGKPLGQFMGYVNDGVYMTQQEFDSQPRHVTSMVGTVRYRDISGPDGVPDGRIDFDDRTIIGDPNPNFLYGITNEFYFKNFDASVVIAGAVGGDIIDGTLEWTENLDAVFNVTKEVAQRWRSPDNPGSGNIPRTRSGTTELFRYNNTRWVSDGSYLAVKNLTVGYTFNVVKKLFTARVYVSTQNPFLITKYHGMNPEVSANGLNGLSQGVDASSYPIPKIYTAGINIRL